MTTANGTPLKAYVWAEDLPLAQIENEQATYLHADHLNTPRLATNSAQTVIWRLERWIFGNLWPQEDPDQNGIPTFIELRGPGQYHDRETGFFYNQQRYLWEAMGRYITSDPIGLAGGLNTYTYVENNPLRWTDPTGLARSKPGSIRNVPCNSEESTRCQATCAAQGKTMQSCKRVEKFKLVRGTQDVSVWSWVKINESCSCNEPPKCPPQKEPYPGMEQSSTPYEPLIPGFDPLFPGPRGAPGVPIRIPIFIP